MEAHRAIWTVPYPEILLSFLPAVDGPPYRSTKVFKSTSSMMMHKIISVNGLPKPVNSYFYVASAGGEHWDKDFENAQPGYFVTGDSAKTSVWRVFRHERDPFSTTILTLSPLVLAGGFPQLNLSTITDGLLVSELQGHYGELQRHVLNNAYRAVITSSKNILEGILSPKRNLADTLRKVGEKIRSAKAQKAKPSISELSYHLSEKIRLLHQLTHTGAAIRKGHSVAPEFALTVVQDLIEVLRDLGYVRK